MSTLRNKVQLIGNLGTNPEGDPTAARAAVEAHMDFVKASLQDSMIAERNEEIAKRRFEHELSRD